MLKNLNPDNSTGQKTWFFSKNKVQEQKKERILLDINQSQNVDFIWISTHTNYLLIMTSMKQLEILTPIPKYLALLKNYC